MYLTFYLLMYSSRESMTYTWWANSINLQLQSISRLMKSITPGILAIPVSLYALNIWSASLSSISYSLWDYRSMLYNDLINSGKLCASSRTLFNIFLTWFISLKSVLTSIFYLYFGGSCSKISFFSLLIIILEISK